ncbi:MAG TPA: VOC family protein [Mucilaginibacter sp.]|jgi:catechol 2,3-dioxygenase-like lactoylglutathione lyase family enzyme|nr:VOC family protein [Mucilaginibacter sp.]
MKFRIARHTTDLNRIIDFYGRILGLKVLGEFKDHHQYSGVFMGLHGQSWHLEFTISDSAPVHHPDNDDLLVFYASSLEEFAAMKTRFVKNKIKLVKPPNPYWEKNGITFEDPDGFRVVISLLRAMSKPG